MIFRQNPTKLDGTTGTKDLTKPQPDLVSSLSVGTLQERIQQLENENARLRLQVQVLRELLHDE